MIRFKSRAAVVASSLGLVAVIAATSLAAASSSTAASRPSWCGAKKITMGFTDGFGGNSWRLVTTAAVREEVKLCPSVTKLYYADGQGKTDKAISDIKGMVAKGVKALVVFPDAGQAMLPALRSAYKAGVVTVPYRVWAGGVAGKDYNIFIGTDFVLAGKSKYCSSSSSVKLFGYIFQSLFNEIQSLRSEATHCPLHSMDKLDC